MKPAQKESITEWAAKNVKLTRSSRSTFADLSLTPWLVEPLEALTGGGASEIVTVAPVGSGKTTLLEILACYIIAAKPGPAMFSGQGDGDAKEWMDSGLMPALKACPLIEPLWPRDRHAIGKSAIFFPHMPLFVCGANLSNFQARSLQYAILDEAWMAKPGLINELRRRNHDRYGSYTALLGQAGNVGEDFDLAFEQCTKHEFSFECPSCGAVQPWRFDSLKWEVDRNQRGYVWDSIAPRYECTCGGTFADTPEQRRALSQSGRYVAQPSPNAINGHLGFTYNALCIWWVPWKKLIQEFLAANEAKKRGDLNPLRQFQNKRLALPWTELQQLEAVAIAKGAYTLADRERWDVTILTIDVQQDYFFFLVRTWTRSGESRMLDFGKALTFSDLEAKQIEWNIGRKAVFLDSAYRREEVLAAMAKNGWLGLNGRGDKDFPATDRTGKPSRRIYSTPIRHQTAHGLAVNTNFSSGAAKDILHILKQGNGARWETPQDAPHNYLAGLNSEIKKQTAKGIEWVQVKAFNHPLDLEAMQIIAAMMHGCYPQLTAAGD